LKYGGCIALISTAIYIFRSHGSNLNYIKSQNNF
jgi:hypothetical protein